MKLLTQLIKSTNELKVFSEVCDIITRYFYLANEMKYLNIQLIQLEKWNATICTDNENSTHYMRIIVQTFVLSKFPACKPCKEHGHLAKVILVGDIGA